MFHYLSPQVGAALLALLLETAKVYNPATRAMEPAVSHTVEYFPQTKRTVGIVRLHEQTVYKLENDDEVRDEYLHQCCLKSRLSR